MDAIASAIRHKHILRFSYHGTVRTVEPHLLGYDTKGHLTLSAWQTAGTGIGWRDFHVSDIVRLSETGGSFTTPRHGFNRFDKTMSRIVASI